MGSKPPADGKGRHGSQRQPNRRVEQPYPFAEQIAAKNPGQLAWDRGNDDLQRLEADKNDRREDAPFSKRVLEKSLIHIEANEELVGGSVRYHEPNAVPDERGSDYAADDPSYVRFHPSPRGVIRCPGQSPASPPSRIEGSGPSRERAHSCTACRSARPAAGPRAQHSAA